MAYSSNLDEDLTPIKEPSHIKLSPQEIIFLKQLNPDELREKFIRVNEDFITLKIFTRKQEDKIMRLQTKLRKLTTDLKGKHVGEKGDSYRLLIVEHEEKIQELDSKISQLQNRNKHLEAKLQVANVQLCAARKNKIPLLYRHITPRIDSGIKRSRISKSLSNIHQATESCSRTATPSVKRNRSKSDYERESSILSTPREEQDSLEMSNQVRFILEEAKKRIIDLEEDQEQLLQQLSECQQNSEDQERELMGRVDFLEKELEKKSVECRERGSQEQKEKMAHIRSERQSRASAARMAALSNHLKEIEDKLRQERFLKEEALTTLDLVREEENEKEDKLKEVHYHNQKQEDEIQEIKANSSYLKKQLRQLEVENQRLTEVVVRERKSSKKRDEPSDSTTQNAINLMQSDKTFKNESTFDLLNEFSNKRSSKDREFADQMTEDVNNRLNKDLNNRLSDLATEVAKKKEEKSQMIQEATKEKEKYLKALLEIEELRTSNKKLSESLEKLSLEKNAMVCDEGLEDLKKSIEEYKQMDKGNIYDKMAFRELKNQYTELQLLYHQKKINLDKAEALLSNHADTYEHLLQEKAALKAQIEKVNDAGIERLKELESSMKAKNDTIVRLENQLLVQHPFPKKEEPGLEVAETGEVLSLHKHHNVLELYMDKMKFSIPVDDGSKIFASWVMFMPLREPLQHTSIARGSPACFRHTTLYKFKMNYSNFFLIRDEVIKVNIYFLLENNHPRKIGDCVISLEELLRHPQNSLHGTVSVDKFVEDGKHKTFLHNSENIGNQDTDTIGSLFYSIRFHKPGEEYISKFRRKVTELKRSEQLVRREEASGSNHLLFTSNSTTSSPKAFVPPVTKIQEHPPRESELIPKYVSGETEKKACDSIADAHEGNRRSNSSSSTSTTSVGGSIGGDRRSISGNSTTSTSGRNRIDEAKLEEGDGPSSCHQLDRRRSSSSGSRRSARSSSNGKVERSSSNGKVERSSSNGKVERSSSNGKVERSSSNGKGDKIKEGIQSDDDDGVECQRNVDREATKERKKIPKRKRKSLNLSKQLMGVFRSKKSMNEKSEEEIEEKRKFAHTGSKLKRMSILRRSKRLFSSAPPGDDSAPPGGDSAPPGGDSKDKPESVHDPKQEKTKRKSEIDNSSSDESGSDDKHDKNDDNDDSDADDKDSKDNKKDDKDDNEDSDGDKDSSAIDNKDNKKDDKDDSEDSDEKDNDDKDDNEDSDEKDNDNKDKNIESDSETSSESSVSESSVSSKVEDHHPSSENVLDKKKMEVKRKPTRRSSPLGSGSSLSSRSSKKSIVESASESSSGSSTPKNESENGILRIEIIGLELNKNSRVARDSSVEHLVVDYFGFLDLEPERVETPNPIPKPKPLIKVYFNFINEIRLSERARQMLDKLQKQDADLKFHLSAEPEKDLPDDDLELGYATLKIRSMLKGYNGGIPIHALTDTAETVGTLFVQASFEE